MPILAWDQLSQASHVQVRILPRTQALDHDLARLLNIHFGWPLPEAKQAVADGVIFPNTTEGKLSALNYIARLSEIMNNNMVHTTADLRVQAWQMPKPAYLPLEQPNMGYHSMTHLVEPKH